MKQPDANTVQRPPLTSLGSELFRAAIELARYQFARSAKTKPGDGHAVVIFPGLGTNGSAVAGLRKHCNNLGYDAMDWGLGFNSGPKGELDVWLHNVKSHIVDLLVGRKTPATLIGWSLGGLYAREIGKLMAPGIRLSPSVRRLMRVPTTPMLAGFFGC